MNYELLGKVIVVTRMRKIPENCITCGFYDNMGGTRGRGNDGVCTADSTYRSTERIKVSKERLKSCPLRLLQGGDE